jgi:hypothetical protein
LIGLVQQPQPIRGCAIARPDAALKAKREEIIWCLKAEKLVLPPAEAAWFLDCSRRGALENYRGYIEWVYVTYFVNNLYWRSDKRKGKT